MAGDYGIQAGSRHGTTLIVVLVLLSLCFYKYGNLHIRGLWLVQLYTDFENNT